ncbi:hypothetical protein O6H91_02G071000 [Diphasiastrum complanatum]|uniref:Uncharacterized protein n=1 Tax=Diphasiastrum complanatum TaxID=34168 RepID=A0ACC2EH98_DIPCM|nr:hypothetical protein O6H91_02G071000 [Diphasiastrum complanatum]
MSNDLNMVLLIHYVFLNAIEHDRPTMSLNTSSSHDLLHLRSTNSNIGIKPFVDCHNVSSYFLFLGTWSNHLPHVEVSHEDDIVRNFFMDCAKWKFKDGKVITLISMNLKDSQILHINSSKISKQAFNVFYYMYRRLFPTNYCHVH